MVSKRVKLPIKEREKIARLLLKGYRPTSIAKVSGYSRELVKALKKTIYETRSNPLKFARSYLKEHQNLATPKFHRDIYRALRKHNRVVVAAPRGFAKSHLISFFYPLFCALTEKFKDILIVSATGTLAEEWLEKIKLELEMNEKLIADFGYQKSRRWRHNHLRLANGVNIRAKGRGYQIRGFRPELVILDDIEDDDLVRSKDQRDKLADWFFGPMINTLAKVEGSQIAMIGTIIHPLCFLQRMLSKDGWWTKKYRAIDKKTGESIWPELYTLVELKEKEKEIGRAKFQCEYMNEPPLQFTPLIGKKENLVFYDQEPPLGSMRIFTAIDPAFSQKDAACQAAIVTAGVVIDERREDTGHIYILEAKAGRYGENKLYDEIWKTKDRFSSEKIGMEKAAYQQVYVKFFQEKAKNEGKRMMIEELSLAGYQGYDRGRLARDKRTRAMSVIFLIENRMVHLRRGQMALYDELLLFPEGDSDDLADAFFYSLIMVLNYHGRPAIVSGKEKPKTPNVFQDMIDLQKYLGGTKTKSWYNY